MTATTDQREPLIVLDRDAILAHTSENPPEFTISTGFPEVGADLVRTLLDELLTSSATNPRAFAEDRIDSILEDAYIDMRFLMDHNASLDLSSRGVTMDSYAAVREVLADAIRSDIERALGECVRAAILAVHGVDPVENPDLLVTPNDCEFTVAGFARPIDGEHLSVALSRGAHHATRQGRYSVSTPGDGTAVAPVVAAAMRAAGLDPNEPSEADVAADVVAADSAFARSLLAAFHDLDAVNEHTHDEYLRGQIELIASALNLGSVHDHLASTAARVFDAFGAKTMPE